MAERKTGAGGMLAGVLERATPHRVEEPDTEAVDQVEAEAPKSRGASRKASAPKASRKATGRTVCIPDDLWERIIVQAHRRKVTISDYVTAILNRQVPDHRTIRGSDAGDEAA
jgi:hypothetical protein